MQIDITKMIIPKYDDVILDMLDYKHRHYSLRGGRGGGKSSYASIAIILLLLNNPQTHALIVKKVADTLRQTVFSQIVWAIGEMNLEHLFIMTVSPMEITFKPTGQKIFFRGADKPERIKGIKTTFGYIGITWFDEIDTMHGRDEVNTILYSTMRGYGGKFINIETFNPPVSATNWANKDLLIERPDRLCIQTSYLDLPVEWLSEAFIDEAEVLKKQNYKAYANQFLGEVTGTGGNVFENLKDETITDAQIKNFDRILNGVDFGYYPDPWAFVRVQFLPAQRILYIFDEAVEHKKGNRETAEIIKKKGVTERDKITCDSAEPKSIADYREFGLRSFGAEKGAGSVEYSHKWLQSLNAIVIDKKRCPKAYTEFSEYEYERDKNGDVISGYPDRDNHIIDAVRYATNELWMRRETPRKPLV